MTRVGLLHTVPALADVFARRITTQAGTPVDVVHVVDPTLLADAVARGVDDDVRARVRAHVEHLAGADTSAVMVTCSSIGEAAEAARGQLAVPLLRVDEPMAEEAVRTASVGRRRIAVLATLESTLGPTRRLIERTAGAHGSDFEISARVVAGAAASRGAGRDDEHDALVRQAVEEAAAGADVVVLAQASMAAAVRTAGAETPAGTPVLESASSGVARLLDVLAAGSGDPRGGVGPRDPRGRSAGQPVDPHE